MMDHPDLRARIVAEARAWLHTPYQPGQQAKGRGCDCARLVKGVFEAVGAIPPFDLTRYDANAPWALRQGDTLYLELLRRYGREIAEAAVQPGDVVMYHLGRGWSHTAIIARWPGLVIHALQIDGVIATTGNTGRLARRATRFWSLVPQEA